MLVGLATLMILIDWQFSLVPLTMMPVLFVLTRICGRRLRSSWSAVKSTESATLACAQEVLSASRVVKAFGREGHEQQRFLSHAMDWVRKHNSLASVGSGFDFMFGMAVALGTATALVVGIDHIKSGRITMGDFLLLMAYMAQFAGPLDTATKKLAELQSCFVGFRRALAILDIPPVDHRSPDGASNDPCAGRHCLSRRLIRVSRRRAGPSARLLFHSSGHQGGHHGFQRRREVDTLKSADPLCGSA